MADGEAVIIIKKIKKGGHAHHGGAWKVAYADFVTAMMAFFLLMWLLNATTEVQKQGISDYFSPVAVSTTSGGAGGLLGGQAISSPGAATSRTSVPSVSLKLEPTSGASAGDAEEEGGADDKSGSAEKSVEEAAKAFKEQQELAAKIESDRFDQVEQQIRATIQQTPDLKEIEKHLLIDRTPEGMRIQVIDREGRPMFASGSAKLLPRTEKMIALVAAAIRFTPNKVRVSGHTDSQPFRRKDGYSNWELSSDRAQASRRVLVDGGLALERIASVEGRASRDPLLPDDTRSQRNRRISILLLKKKAEGGASKAATQSTAPSGAAGKPVGAPAAPSQPPLNKDWTGPRVR